MKTGVTGEDGSGHIVYKRFLLALAQHYGFHPRACRPHRAKTKGKVERPFSYIRQDFFLARTFRNLDDLNAQLDDWLTTVANLRMHGTTQKVVAEAFAAERAPRVCERLPRPVNHISCLRARARPGAAEPPASAPPRSLHTAPSYGVAATTTHR